MLPWIIGGAVVLVASAIASGREAEAENHYRNKLEKQYKKYADDLQRIEKNNRLEKQKKLFRQIKKEQQLLKEQRRQMIALRNSVRYGSKEWNMFNDRAKHLKYLIEQKQADADRVRL